MSRRIVILTAAVGEGHVAAARTLDSDLRQLDPTADVVVVDALAVLGPLLRFVLRDGYRLQLRFTPWLFGAFYALFTRLRPLRALGRGGLALLGARRLERSLNALGPDVVVSTYPAATSVLGVLKRRRRVSAVAAATITDLGGVTFWSHPGIDLHLVMHPALVEQVEQEAGRGSCLPVRPLVGAHLQEARSSTAARLRLGLPTDRRIVLVSGGGWGVGNLGAAVAAVRAASDAVVVCVTGRNARKEQELVDRFRDDPDVIVLGFVTTMPLLLAGADVLVHTTGGVTCLEAMACGVPIIAYSVPQGHGPTVSRSMERLGVARYARSRRQLARALQASLANDRLPDRGDGRVSAAVAVLAAGVRPLPERRRPRSRLVVAASVATIAAVFVASTDKDAFGASFPAPPSARASAGVVDVQPGAAALAQPGGTAREALPADRGRAG